MSIEIRLLGPVEFTGDRGPVHPGPTKRRAVLAALALEANHPVPLSRLSVMLWTGPPPASGVANIRNHIGMLRRTLRHRLVSRPSAYQLNLVSAELDVSEFQRLAEAGRLALATGMPARAETDLMAALRRWRGPAGDGIRRGTALDRRFEALDEHRLRVLEDLVDARLGLGRYGEVISGLREHVTAHPLRERAWAQLMLALYRTGDTGAALSAFRQAHTVLREQLGMDPGAELIALQRDMLDRAPHLDPPVTDRSVPRSASLAGNAEVPRELPPEPLAAFGQSDELAAVLAGARPSPGGRTPAAVVVHGPPGSGKSTLLIRAGHRLAEAFPDGQIFMTGADMRPDAAQLVGRVLRALGVAAADVPAVLGERIGRYRSLLASRRVLIILDDVADAEQVRPLISAHPGSALLVTSREALLELDGVPHVELRPSVGAADSGGARRAPHPA